MEFYTVLFGVSRAFGVAAQLIWDRALGARAYISAPHDMIIGLKPPFSAGASQVVLYHFHPEDVRQQELTGRCACLTFRILYDTCLQFYLSPDPAWFPRSLFFRDV